MLDTVLLTVPYVKVIPTFLDYLLLLSILLWGLGYALDQWLRRN